MADKHQDLKEQYDVRLEQGLDAFVVVDGLPIVPEESKPKLVKFVVKKLNAVGKVKEDGFFMPVNDQGKTEGYVHKYTHLKAGSHTQVCLCRVSNNTAGYRSYQAASWNPYR